MGNHEERNEKGLDEKGLGGGKGKKRLEQIHRLTVSKRKG